MIRRVRRENNSITWHSPRQSRFRVGRLQVAFTVHRHTYPTSSDRLVFQPTVIWDRKAKSTWSNP